MNLSQENLTQINKIKSAGKQVMQIMVTKCKSIYKTGMTEKAFVDVVYEGIKEEERAMEGVSFFKKVYFYLSTDKKDAEIELLESGSVTLALMEKSLHSSPLEAIVVNTEVKLPLWLQILLRILKAIIEALLK